MAMLARWECGITEKDPEARVDCTMAYAPQFTIEPCGSVHGTVGAVAMERSRQTDMPVGEVDTQYVDSMASVVSVIYLHDSVWSRVVCGEGGAHKGAMRAKDTAAERAPQSP
jgi:hypothetical protein